MTRRLRAAAAAIVLVVLSIIGHAAPATAGAPDLPTPPAPRRVVIVSIPRLGWDDVVPADMPTLAGLADQGAVGVLSVRAIGRHTGVAEGYASLGAGNRAQAADDEAGTYGRAERLPSGTLALAELIHAGHTPRGAGLVPGIDAVVSANAHTHQGARIGALGGALRAAHWTTTLVSDSDGWDGSRGAAGLALVDPEGSIDASIPLDVPTPTALSSPPAAADPAVVAAAVRRLPTQRSAAIVELGDVARADAIHGDRGVRQEAARRVDRDLAAVIDELDLRQDLVIVLAPVAPSPQAQPTPMVVAGPGIEPGLLRTATTRRAGYVTLPDVAPGLLSWIGLDAPSAMNGTPIEVVPDARSGLDRLAWARTTIAETRFVDRSQGKLMSTLPITFGAWSVLLLVAAFVRLGPLRRPARVFLRWVGLVISATPVVAFVLAASSTRGWGQPTWFAMLFGGAMVVASVAAAVARPHARLPWLAPVLIAGLTWTVLVVDLVTGGHLQFDSAFGNSPTVAGRFTGVGNLSFALLAATTLVLACIAHALIRDNGAPRAGVAVAATLFALAVVLDGLPGLGDDVGGVLALVPSAFICLWLLAGRRFTVRAALAAAAAGAALVGLFGLYDLSRPAADRTHLGRLLGGDTAARETVIRKAVSAGTTVYHSSLVWILVSTIGLGLIAWMTRRVTLERAIPERSDARVLAVSAIVLGVLGGLLNDSGVAVPAMMAVVFVPAAVYVLLQPEPDPAAPSSEDTGVGQADRVLP